MCAVRRSDQSRSFQIPKGRCAPYLVRLDDGREAYVPKDTDLYIQRGRGPRAIEFIAFSRRGKLSSADFMKMRNKDLPVFKKVSKLALANFDLDRPFCLTRSGDMITLSDPLARVDGSPVPALTGSINQSAAIDLSARVLTVDFCAAAARRIEESFLSRSTNEAVSLEHHAAVRPACSRASAPPRICRAAEESL